MFPVSVIAMPDLQPRTITKSRIDPPINCQLLWLDRIPPVLLHYQTSVYSPT